MSGSKTYKRILVAAAAVVIAAALVIAFDLTKPYAVYADGTRVDTPYVVKADGEDKAIETLNSAAQAKKNGTLYTTLGMLLVEKARQTGDYEAALQFNQEAYDYDDEDAGVLDNMGQLALLLSDKARGDGDDEQAAEQRGKALEYFKKAYELKPEQISSSYYLARMYHENGMDDKARALIDEILKIPFSAIMQISKEDVLALQKELN